ncbi:hypothetical protein FRC04_010814 [Tulasnella sp. 424]|nr:hypothetical protein FRC04_010814 [Tulasnella sp. 424]
MHPALLLSEILTPILSSLSPHNLAVACRVCWTFWQHATPLLWADLSRPGLQALYTAFPADAMLAPELYSVSNLHFAPISPELYSTGRLKSSFRRLARPLTYEEASRIGALAGLIRKASINAQFDLLAENNSPLSSVQDLVGGKIFSNLQAIELKDLAWIPIDESVIRHPALCRDHLFGILQRALPLFIGPSTKHISIDGGPPNTPAMDFIKFVLGIMIHEGAAPWTFRVFTKTGQTGGPELPPLTDHKTFTQSMEIALASVKRLSLIHDRLVGPQITDPELDAASRLPELIELDYAAPANEHPYSETAFPQLQTIRIAATTRGVRNLLCRVPPRRLRNLKVDMGDDGDEFYPCLTGHSEVQSFSLRAYRLDLRGLLNCLNMRQLTHLTLLSRFGGPPFTDADVELLAESFPDLVSLELRESWWQEKLGSTTISSLQILARRCPKLRKLALSVNIQPVALMAEAATSSTGIPVSETLTHPSLRDLDLRFSRGIGDGGSLIQEVVTFIVRMYPNLQRGRHGAAAGDAARGPHPDDAMIMRTWWKVWKDVEGELGDSFTIAYNPKQII